MLRTPSANHRLLGQPTGSEDRDESCCAQRTRWLFLYLQTVATLRRHFSRAVAAAVFFCPRRCYYSGFVSRHKGSCSSRR